MDDFVYIEDMKLEMNILNRSNNEIESKAYNMIAITGVLLGLQGTLLNSYPFTNFVLDILFMLPIIAFLISIYFFIKNLQVKGYHVLPCAEGVVKYYEEEYCEEEYISTMIGNYEWVINENTEVINSKSEFNKKGLYCFEVGLLFISIFCMGFMIL